MRRDSILAVVRKLTNFSVESEECSSTMKIRKMTVKLVQDGILATLADTVMSTFSSLAHVNTNSRTALALKGLDIACNSLQTFNYSFLLCEVSFTIAKSGLIFVWVDISHDFYDKRNGRVGEGTHLSVSLQGAFADVFLAHKKRNVSA